jgi:hypothetical protein
MRVAKKKINNQWLVYVREGLLGLSLLASAVTFASGSFASESSIVNSTLFQTVRGSIFQAAEVIILALAGTMVLVAGVQYVMAYGDKGGKGIEDARNTLVYALSGVAFWYLACLIIPNCREGYQGILGGIFEALRSGGSGGS